MEIKGPVRTGGGRWAHGKVRHVFGRTSVSTPPSGPSGPSGASAVDPHGRPVALHMEADESNDAVRT